MVWSLTGSTSACFSIQVTMCKPLSWFHNTFHFSLLIIIILIKTCKHSTFFYLLFYTAQQRAATSYDPINFNTGISHSTFMLENIPGFFIWFQCICSYFRLCGTRSLQPYSERFFLFSMTVTVVMTSEVSLTGPGLQLHYSVFNLSDRKWRQKRRMRNMDKGIVG